MNTAAPAEAKPPRYHRCFFTDLFSDMSTCFCPCTTCRQKYSYFMQKIARFSRFCRVGVKGYWYNCSLGSGSDLGQDQTREALLLPSSGHHRHIITRGRLPVGEEGVKDGRGGS